MHRYFICLYKRSFNELFSPETKMLPSGTNDHLTTKLQYQHEKPSFIVLLARAICKTFKTCTLWLLPLVTQRGRKEVSIAEVHHELQTQNSVNPQLDDMSVLSLRNGFCCTRRHYNKGRRQTIFL